MVGEVVAAVVGIEAAVVLEVVLSLVGEEAAAVVGIEAAVVLEVVAAVLLEVVVAVVVEEVTVVAFIATSNLSPLRCHNSAVASEESD